MFELVAISFFLGASLGSFINVCSYRVPRRISVVQGRSFCPVCGQVLRWFELIPIVSYLVICRGRCTHCGAPISLRYPVVEFLSGAWVVLVVHTGGLSGENLLLVVFGLSMLLVGLIDWQHYVIPNRVLLWTLLLTFSIKATTGLSTLLPALLCMGASFLVAFLIQISGRHVFGRDVMGMGDVKLVAVIAFMLGLPGVLLSLWLGAAGGLTLGAMQRITCRNQTQKDVRIPFGSFLALSSVLFALFGGETEGFVSLRGMPWLSF